VKSYLVRTSDMDKLISGLLCALIVVDVEHPVTGIVTKLPDAQSEQQLPTEMQLAGW
jgi:hypothetical protein